MKISIYSQIENSTAHRKSREKNRNYILKHPELMEEMITFCFSISDKNHHKACWIMELVAESKIDSFFPYTKIIIDKIHLIKDESALRSISGIILQLANNFTYKNSNLFDYDDLEKISTTAFDWLINDIKVATKAHAMKILFLIGKKQDWIYPELNTILSQDAYSHSAGYKSCARKILKKIL